ncbi:hypothetical protein ABZ734_08315 [Streptomyces sp. NPDC006660]|uniref:hypothetical protein n=1 Tax=Streptomyces sp. NPDC006660 TaxID=3156901 RepID=UPI0033C69DD8
MNPIEQGVGPALPETVRVASARVPGEVWGRVTSRALTVLLALVRGLLLVASVLLAIGLSPVLLCLRVLGPRLPAPVRGPARLVLLSAAYLLTCEVGSLVAGLRLRRARRRGPGDPSDHDALRVLLARRSTAAFFATGLRWAGMRVRWPDEPPRLDPARPVVVLLRHAGLLNTQLGIHLGMKVLRRRVHGVCKSAAVLLPGAASLVGLTPLIPLRWNAEGRARAGREFAAMGPGLGGGDAAVILPEGTNFSARRRRARIAYLRRSGRHDLAAAAEAMPCVLPPLARGAAALLAAAPTAQVLVVGHTGLEDVLPWRLGGGYPARTDAAVHVAWGTYEAAEVPRDRDGFETWLYERWAELDAWVLATRRDGAAGEGRPLR